MAIIRNFILLTGAIVAVFVGLKIKTLIEDAPVPVLRKDVWWGRGERRPEDPAIRGYKIEVPDTVITDLSDRLDRFLKKPITPPLENIQFQYGFNTDYLRTVIQYWKDKYLPNWRNHQKKLNSYPQFVTTVNGLKLHYIRVSPTAPEGKRVLPLLILHGWPGSVREFYDIIPLLTRPNDKTDFIFEVIAPSLPGYGFSEGAAKPGMGPAEMAVVLNNLMAKLGFNKYYVQGGDWGAVLAKSLGQLYPNTILGVHSNMCFVSSQLAILITTIGSQLPLIVVDKPQEHLMYPFADKFNRLVEESGYYHLQATKPDTIGVALGDTPAGLAAYILEKFVTWTDPEHRSLSDGNIPKKYSLDALLDNVMIYWVSNSATTSMRLYSESKIMRPDENRLDSVPIHVPTACGRFTKELYWQSTALFKLQYRNLVHVADYEAGHFAAMEVPQVLANDVITAVAKMEKLQQ